MWILRSCGGISVVTWIETTYLNWGPEILWEKVHKRARPIQTADQVGRHSAAAAMVIRLPQPRPITVTYNLGNYICNQYFGRPISNFRTVKLSVLRQSNSGRCAVAAALCLVVVCARPISLHLHHPFFSFGFINGPAGPRDYSDATRTFYRDHKSPSHHPTSNQLSEVRAHRDWLLTSARIHLRHPMAQCVTN